MTERHTGIVLRASSAQKSSITLLDSTLGKIEALCTRGERVSHGSLLSYGVKKGNQRYFLRDVKLLDMPIELARDNCMFLHHVLELCDYFVPWDIRVGGLFALVHFLYRNAGSVETPDSQKLFLAAFFKRVGVHPGEGQHKDGWLTAFISEHPQLLSLQTAGYLKTLEGYEELA
jgi:hypothetical protein